MIEQIPTYEECQRPKGRELTPLEIFIINNEPQGEEDCKKFRSELTRAVNFVWNNAVAGASFEVEEYPGLKQKILKNRTRAL